MGDAYPNNVYEKPDVPPKLLKDVLNTQGKISVIFDLCTFVAITNFLRGNFGAEIDGEGGTKTF